MKSSVRSVHREVACQCWYILRSAVQRPSVHHVPLLPADSSGRREPESSLRSGFELPTARKALPGSFAQEREACAAERRTALPRLLSSRSLLNKYSSQPSFRVLLYRSFFSGFSSDKATPGSLSSSPGRCTLKIHGNIENIIIL